MMLAECYDLIFDDPVLLPKLLMVAMPSMSHPVLLFQILLYVESIIDYF